ncbi:PH domain-containing protein [Marivirga tractuosa]|uniref:PH domain-containing protein n=1 Tax=Marivirga tractuosa TaxID=1006 RepID=UPI0035CFF734
MKKKYPSKVSYGLLLFIFVLIENGLGQGIFVKMVFPIILYGFIVYLFFNTSYTIENGQLKIKFGFFSFKPIDIKDIKEISKTNSILSSPAPSFDRIEIKYGKQIW